jgi:hypothetical protein
VWSGKVQSPCFDIHITHGLSPRPRPLGAADVLG